MGNSHPLDVRVMRPSYPGGERRHFPLGQVFDKGLKLAGGQAPVQPYIDKLLDLARTGKLEPERIVSHQLPLAQAPRGYEVLNDKKEDCVKVVLTP